MENIFEKYSDDIGTVKSDFSEYEHIVETEPKDVLEEKNERPSFNIIYLALIAGGLFLIMKLLNLQVVSGSQYQYLAEGNRIRERLIEAPRGIIYDRNNIALVSNVGTYRLQLVPADLPRQKDERIKVYELLKTVANYDTSSISQAVEKQGLYSLEPMILKDNLEKDEALNYKVKFASVSGIQVVSLPNRKYNFMDSLSHILGYTGKISEDELKNHPDYNISDRIGKSGLEFVYDNYLRGNNGQDQFEVDSKGQIQRILATKDPVEGNNLILNLDLGLQEKATGLLADMINKKQTSSGVIIAVDPQSGGILAMVSLPGYDDNLFSGGINKKDYQNLLDDPSKPLINRATSGQYPSGSTIKPMMAAAGLEEGIINESTTINDSGQIAVGDYVFPDWKAHGKVDVKKAIAESCDVFFYAVGGGWDKIKGLGVNKIKNYMELFGFGKKTGIDLDSEQDGLVPDATWKKKVKNEPWYVGDTYHMSIGQGDISVTPLQLLMATSSFANGGELLKPHIASKIMSEDGKEIKNIEKEVIRKDFINSKNIEIVKEGMRQTIISGSARSINEVVNKDGKNIEASGKTGTAQFGTEDKTHAWFTGFAPYDSPNISFVILVEGGGEGSDAAVPIAKELFNYWFNR